MSRLPVPGSDDNTWGDVLNDFLGVSLNGDGTVKTGVITTTQILDGTITTTDLSASAAIARTQLSTGVQSSLASADSALQSVPAATSSVTGGVRLTGDLGGTATAPTTPTAVHLTGNETIAGTKTFTDATTQFSTVYAPQGGSTDTNYSVTVTSSVPQRSVGINPLSAATYHELLAFNRWWGTPTFTVSTDGTTYTGGTLDSNLFAGKDSSSYTVIDGTTNISARWQWNSSNIPYSYARTWALGLAYQATAAVRNVTLESSADGSTWTNRFTGTGINANQSQYYFLATDWSADTYIRLTISVTNSQALILGGIRAYSPRWGSQGGGKEISLPYSWDSAARLTIGAGTTTYSNGVLNVGGATPTTAANGIYFGTDTNLYRAGTTNLKTDQKLTAGGGLQIGASSTTGQVWTASDTAGNGSWQTFSSSGYGRSVNLMSASVTAGSTNSTDYIYYWNGSAAYTLTMPTAVGNTDRYTLKNASTIAQTVATTVATPSQTIEGTSTISIRPNNSVDLISDGANWMVI